MAGRTRLAVTVTGLERDESSAGRRKSCMSPPHSHRGLAGVLLVCTTDPPDVHTAATPRQGTEGRGASSRQATARADPGQRGADGTRIITHTHTHTTTHTHPDADGHRQLTSSITHSLFHSGLNPSFSAHPPYRSLSFVSSKIHYMDFPDCLLLLLSISVFLLFSFFSVFTLF